MEKERLQQIYPAGTLIKLEKMEGEPHMYSGLRGIVSFIDDAGQIHMSWDNGSSLALNPGVDSFEKIEQISVLLVEPGKHPEIIKIDNALRAMQQVVEGLIEVYQPFEDNAIVICNEEGKFNGMYPNRAIYSGDGRMEDVIFGPFFICSESEDGDFKSLSDDLMKKYKEMFEIPEMFYTDFDGALVSY